MKKLLHPLLALLLAFGLDGKKFLFAIAGLPRYYLDLAMLRRQEKEAVKLFVFGRQYYCLDDRFRESGVSSGHYFYQDWLVANLIFRNNPEFHIDVGSRIDGFVAHIASFRSLRVIDIRPLRIKIPQVEFISADLMKALPSDLVESCDSLSCLHALEHFGLGRYGDPVNYEGYLIGLRNLFLLLKPGGKFYLSVPIGPQRIEFNAHRVFSCGFLLELFKGRFSVDSFSYVDDAGELHQDINIDTQQIARNFGCNYGCGIFELTKISGKF